MTNTSIADFRENVCEMLDATISGRGPLRVSTERGRAVVLSESDYKDLLETLYISGVPNLKDEILRRASGGEEEFAGEDEIWL